MDTLYFKKKRSRIFLTILYLALGIILQIAWNISQKRFNGKSFIYTKTDTFFITFNFATFVASVSASVFFIISILYRGSQSATNIIYRSSPIIPERRKFIRNLGVLAAAIPFAGIIYGVWKGRFSFKIFRETLVYKDLPEAFDGFTIMQISDIHAGTFDSLDVVQKGIDLMKTEKVDLLLFTGDLVNGFYKEVEPYMEAFATTEAKFGKFSVLGNHDYGRPYFPFENDAALEEHHQKLAECHALMGFQLLKNEHRLIEKDGATICLAGCENWGESHHFPKNGDLAKTFNKVPDNMFTVLMSHDPTHWDHQMANTRNILNFPKKVHLTLSGHTHGMQFGVELPFFKWSPVKYIYKNWAGLYEDVTGQKLYVNRGFGEIGYPGRVGVWPEITLIELKKG